MGNKTHTALTGFLSEVTPRRNGCTKVNSQENGWEEHLQNDVFYVQLVMKP